MSAVCIALSTRFGGHRPPLEKRKNTRAFDAGCVSTWARFCSARSRWAKREFPRPSNNQPRRNIYGDGFIEGLVYRGAERPVQRGEPIAEGVAADGEESGVAGSASSFRGTSGADGRPGESARENFQTPW